MPKRNITNRYTPIIENVDQNVQAYMANAGYKSVSVPPGMSIQQPQEQVQQQIIQQQPQQFVNQPIVKPVQIQPNITPNSNNQVIEPGSIVNVQGVQPINANPEVQISNNQQSAVGRNSPYTINNQAAQAQVQANEQQVQQNQQPQSQQQQQVQGQQELSNEYVVDDNGNLQVVQQQEPNQQQLPQQPQVQQSNINPIIPQTPVNAPNTEQMTNLMQQNQLLQNAMLEMRNGNGNGNATQQLNQAPKALPKLIDFTKDLGEDWNPDEALKPTTKSGAAYTNWMDARDSFRDEQYQNQFVNLITEREQSSRSLHKAEEFANVNPQFKNPLTGKADVPKIKAFLEGAIDGDWNTLFNALNVRQNPQLLLNNQYHQQPVQSFKPQQQPQQQFVQQPMVLPAQVNAAANNISPIVNVGGGSTTVQNPTANVPDSVKILQSTYGKNFQLPPGAQIDNTKYFNIK